MKSQIMHEVFHGETFSLNKSSILHKEEDPLKQRIGRKHKTVMNNGGRLLRISFESFVPAAVKVFQSAQMLTAVFVNVNWIINWHSTAYTVFSPGFQPVQVRLFNTFFNTI